MTFQVRRAAVAALLIGVSAGAVQAEMAAPTAPPEPPKFEAQTEPVYVNRSDIFEFKALPAYSEPAWVTAFVDAGKLPPVAERLPKEPLVYKTANMPDGPGVYGDVMRHVIGGRPEGWNFWAGQSYGWGGIDIGLVECLTRTGPLFTVNSTDLQPLPNLARSWEWSEDGKTLTIKLIEGAKWSDGDPFDVQDIEFYWNDVIMDENVTPLMGASPATYNNATFAVVDDYTFTLTFADAFPEQVLYAMAYGNFCPGPSHVLKPKHPKHGGESYEAFLNAFPSDYMNFPTMGAWVVVEHRPDDIVVKRRNPYYWKVDETGQQLPYLDEMHFRLSTWGDRDVQAVAGTGDFSNLEQPENYVESLKKAADPASPARLAFGPRSIGYQMFFNQSANGWGEPDARAQAVRELNRNLDFRKAVTYGLDRQRLGDSLVKGPFTAPYAGGLLTSTSFYDPASTVFFPFDQASAKEALAAAGLTDTDGNGVVNLATGDDLTVTLLVNSDYATDGNLAEGVVAMMADVGIKVTLNSLTGKDFDNARDAGAWDWLVLRNNQEFVSAVQGTNNLAPVGPVTAVWHRANGAGEMDLQPYEQQLVDAIKTFTGTRDPAAKVEAMKTWQKTFTENVTAVGLTSYPGALIINKRFANIPAGAPIFMYNWAEDNIIRERVFVPTDKQIGAELHPQMLPGAPGSPGPVAAN
ncbi:MAG: ABC transporter substrate-binding protein [Tabrizicola sp.]|uniref:ABC transporter substrate-binding protein n=1 Tax=Tabrizicola sp. TaxID=2005166 RepID=UPI002ABBD50E|nr:ABC transporter substrate-binding protein [Tabrizicola sp.]MDZ4087764.1 ABC transporter substrate-binding protein [Tabrizicola sp.]